MNGVNNLQQGKLFFSGADKAFTLGLFSSFASMAVGGFAATLLDKGYSSFAVGAVQAGLHAATGGIVSHVSGGNFSSGFFSGAAASLIAGTAGKIETGNTLWNGVVQIGAGGVAGGISSVIAGGDFANGFSQGVITAGLNHFAHRIQEKQSLDSFAKEKFGADYKTKYGVKSLKWGSQMKNGEVAGYSYNSKEMMIVGPEGGTGGITTPDRRIYISDYHKALPNDFLQATLGHEFIHSYHHMIFGSNYVQSYSEYAAYQYSIDFTTKSSVMDQSMTRQFKIDQRSYIRNSNYNYHKIPGF